MSGDPNHGEAHGTKKGDEMETRVLYDIYDIGILKSQASGRLG